MKEYLVKRLEKNSCPAWQSAAAAEISVYPWGGDYRPKAQARLMVSEHAFLLHMESWEIAANMRAVERGASPVVYQDSCMEFFLRPFSDSLFYINLEVNSEGALHVGAGHSRSERKKPEIAPEYLKVDTFKYSQDGQVHWGFSLELPFELVARLAEPEQPEYRPEGDLWANFYICGDKTPVPHFGVWNDIDWETPDFHRPEFFGRLVLE